MRQVYTEKHTEFSEGSDSSSPGGRRLQGGKWSQSLVSCLQGPGQGCSAASVLGGQFLTTHMHAHAPLEACVLVETRTFLHSAHKYTCTLTPCTHAHTICTLTHTKQSHSHTYTHTIHTHAHSLPHIHSHSCILTPMYTYYKHTLPCTLAHVMCIPVHTQTHVQHSSLLLLPVSLGFLNNRSLLYASHNIGTF